MKFNLNKVCDLSSISVLPPHSRKATNSSMLAESSASGPGRRSQTAVSQQLQLHSMPQQNMSMSKQQQFSQLSQGMSMSQLSQNSLDDFPANEPRIGSQERDLTVKGMSGVKPIIYARRWKSASAPDIKCQVNEELEHRIGLMETSVSRLGMILDSVQGDVMQVNRSVKEVILGIEGIQQKLALHDKRLQQMVKGQEDIKSRSESDLKSIHDKLQKDAVESKLGEIRLSMLALPHQIQAQMLNVQDMLMLTLTREVAKVNSLKPHGESHKLPTFVLPNAKVNSLKLHGESYQVPTFEPPNKNAPSAAQSTNKKLVKKIASPPLNCHLSRKYLKAEPAPFLDSCYNYAIKKEHIYAQEKVEKENQSRIVIESDVDMDMNDGLSILVEEKEIDRDASRMAEEDKEVERILRKARRRKRKTCTPILVV